MDFAHTCACASGVRPALTCEDAAVSGKKKAGKKRALTDKSKKAAVKKPMSKAQGKKKAAVNKKANAYLWYDSSDNEEEEEEMPVARVVGVEDESDSDSSPPWDEHVPGPDATSNDESD